MSDAGVTAGTHIYTHSLSLSLACIHTGMYTDTHTRTHALCVHSEPHARTQRHSHTESPHNVVTMAIPHGVPAISSVQNTSNCFGIVGRQGAVVMEIASI